MADQTDSKSTNGTAADKQGGVKRPTSTEPQMGAALRSVYQQTVEEAVPDEFLDLLSKLD